MRVNHHHCLSAMWRFSIPLATYGWFYTSSSKSFTPSGRHRPVQNTSYDAAHKHSYEARPHPGHCMKTLLSMRSGSPVIPLSQEAMQLACQPSSNSTANVHDSTARLQKELKWIFKISPCKFAEDNHMTQRFSPLDIPHVEKSHQAYGGTNHREDQQQCGRNLGTQPVDSEHSGMLAEVRKAPRREGLMMRVRCLNIQNANFGPRCFKNLEFMNC